MKAALPHILIIDDDERLRRLIKKYLYENGFVAVTARDALHAREILQYLEFDLLVLDVMMPGETGLEFLHELRKSSQIPVLMLTAQNETSDRISGLEMGADDYLAKPFEPKELVLRINSILKRVKKNIRFGEFEFSIETGVLKYADEIISLTAAEENLLILMAEKNNKIVKRDEIAAILAIPNERAVDVQINRLRKKLGGADYLQSVRGKGYRLKV